MSDPVTPADPPVEHQNYLTEAEGREVADIVGRLGDDGLTRTERTQQLVALSRLVGTRARRAGASAVASGRMLGDLLLEAAPHIPIRDLETLSAHHRGLDGEALADALVRTRSAPPPGSARRAERSLPRSGPRHRCSSRCRSSWSSRRSPWPRSR